MKKENMRKKRSQSSIIDAAMNFEMDQVIKRYSKDHDVPLDIATHHAHELKRFLVLCALHPLAKYGMRGPVDDVWHTFIFYTKEYFRFCHTIAGTYIHHIPDEPEAISTDSQPGKEWAELRRKKILPYANMLAAYRLVFQEDPPSEIWPTPPVPKPSSGFQDGDGCSGEGCASACGNSCNGCGEGCGSCGSGCAGCTSCGGGGDQ